MAVTATYKDGVVTNSTTIGANTVEAKKNQTKGSGSTLDKDAFLQLLVAQMKYQDPMEPTTNTEYISQYATFSEVEQMTNMSATMELSRATGLVGQTVSVAQDGEVVDTGVVDYVTYENNKALVWVNGTSYELSAVTQVSDTEYLEAYGMAATLLQAVQKLPSINDLTLDSKDAVESIQATFDSMSEYQQSFVASDTKNLIHSYTEKMAELVKLNELADDNNSEG
ncbi:MAG: flagellar hook capping protein [Lachnospiraceae bacterium]|nr:flagellar hook capping protein [Lachnospiraceae bacterium]